MNKRLMYAILAVALAAPQFSVLAADEPPAERYTLKDGSSLYIHPDGTMRMIDVHGKPMRMAGGEEMELEDGSLIIMLNKKVWRTLGPPGKGLTILTTE